MTHKRSNRKLIKRHFRILAIILVPVVALILGLAMPGYCDDDDEEEIPFDVAEIFFELNNTDGDLGIHALIDGEPWKRLEIEDPRERQMLKVKVKGRLRRQGLTEIFFESAEPTFDELDPEDFFRRFPAGEYEVEGVTLEGEELESETELTHVLPAPPVVFINGEPAAESCDAEELPEVSADDDVIIAWDEVTMSHNEIGEPGVSIEVVNYEVVVEIDDTPWVSSTILPSDARSFEVPEEILELVEIGDEIKFEVLVREASYNQTAVESCFEIVEDDADDEGQVN